MNEPNEFWKAAKLLLGNLVHYRNGCSYEDADTARAAKLLQDFYNKGYQKGENEAVRETKKEGIY